MLRRGWIRAADDIGVLEKQVTDFFGVPNVESLRELQLPFAARMSADYKAPTMRINDQWRLIVELSEADDLGGKKTVVVVGIEDYH